MRIVLMVAAAAAFLPQSLAAQAGACIADKFGLVCGEGKDALRVFPDTLSPSKTYAFAWKSPTGLTSGHDLPSDVEDDLVRLADGHILAKLGGQDWTTGQSQANRYALVAAWSPDGRAVVEVANSRWDTDSFRYYAIDGDRATTLDLHALAEKAVRAKRPGRDLESLVFRVREDLPVKLDAKGNISFTTMLFVPKSAAEHPNYRVQIAITSRRGEPTARVVSVRWVYVDPRL